MTRRALWLVAAILSLGVPLVSTAGGAPSPPQAGATQTTNSAKSGDNQAADPAKDGEQTSDEPVQAGQPPATPSPEHPGGTTTDEPVQAGQPAAALPPNTGDAPTVEPAQAVQPAAAPAVPGPDHAADNPPTDSVSEADDSTLTSTASTPKQQQLRKDTAKLLQLVRELRVDVDKAGKDQLSVAAVRKANEIQKLAKDLGERMREFEQVPGNRP